MKRRNPRWGCPRIAQQIALAFAVDIDKDVVCDGASRTSERAATPTARWSLRSKVLPGLAWVEVEPSAVKIDRRREV